MVSRIDEFVTAIAARYDDTGVGFVAGKLRINEHSKQRTIIFTRESGVFLPRSSPGALRHSPPETGAGTVTRQIFTRRETLEVRLRDRDEESLDNMLDRFIDACFGVCGPNCFDETTPYQWFGDDSKNGGDWIRRNPSIILQMTIDLRSIPQNNPYAIVLNLATDVDEFDETTTVTTP